MRNVQSTSTCGANDAAIAISHRSNGSASKYGRGFATSIITTTIVFLVQSLALPAAEQIESDVCIYGGTVAGVAAAIQTVRMGKTVVIAEFGNHIGGISLCRVRQRL